MITRVPGIDVSRWQGEIDWHSVAEVGNRFAVIRATVGNQYTDPRFAVNWSSARDAGLLVSAYHVLKPMQSADSQMAHLRDVLGNRKADLPLVLDIELHDDLSNIEVTTRIRECLRGAERIDKRKPVIYTARWFWNIHVLSSSEWSQYDLWVANYDVDTPSLPTGWSECKFWQYSQEGNVPGISAKTDLNWFAGTHDELLQYSRGHRPQKSQTRRRVPKE